MNFCRPETRPMPDIQGDRLDALALGAGHQPLEVSVGMVLGLLLAEEGGESFVEVDQLLGRGAHVVRCHGGSLPTSRERSDEPAGSCMLNSLSVNVNKPGRFLLRL